jgi:SMI1 / KNR4 family (SUKH-1)
MINFIPNEDKLNPDVFSDLEKLTGVKMPNDFVEFYCNHSAIESTEGDLFIDVDNEPFQFDDLFPVEYMIEKVEQLLQHGLNPNQQGVVIPFGYDSALNWFCFHFENGTSTPNIIWMNSEQLVLEGSQLSGIIKVRDTFTNFLSDLYEEE